MKEYLNKETHEFVKSSSELNDMWIEIPEGAEIAIKFKYDPDDFGVIFYKNNGKSCFSQNDKAWQNDADWTMKDLLNEDYCEDGIDLSHDVLWQRESEAKPLVDWSNVINNAQQIFDHENAGNPSPNDQYAEIEQVRQAIKLDGGNDSNHTADAMEYAFMGVVRDNVRQHRHYFIDVSDVDEIDFYEIALRYNVTDPCIQHILKKCLAVGQRGQKDLHHDLKDIYDTAKRMLDVHGLDS